MPKAKHKIQTINRPNIRPRWTNGSATCRYINISNMTLWRWLHDPALRFPKPRRIRGRNIFDLDRVDDWMEENQEA
jgi:excisionase family DNA binding protein